MASLSAARPKATGGGDEIIFPSCSVPVRELLANVRLVEA